MKVFELKETIETLLEQNANGRFIVITPRNRKSDAEDIVQKPQVTVFYAEGNFDKRKSSVNSPYHHDCTFNIHVQVASKSTVNLAILQNQTATAEQCAAALSESGNASLAVDKKTDELLSLLYDILMASANRNLGTDYNTNRWVTDIKKYNPENFGAIVVEAASLRLTTQCEEEINGDPAGQGGNVDTVVDLGDDAKLGALT